MSHIEPITISITEYRALLVFLIVMPPIWLAATITASVWLAEAFVWLTVRK